LLALARPIDHDESQYVAAAVLTAHGLLPYRDYAYLQTPLQPFLFAAVAWGSGVWTWPALRIVNALLGGLAVACVHGAAREVGQPRMALVAAALFACCDILLFSVGTARNDALPAACLAGAVWLAVRTEAGRGTPLAALGLGLLLSSAAAAKISYALPAAGYGCWALWRHGAHRPLFVMLGAVPAVALVAWTAWLAPAGFLFGVFTFPTMAPADFYADRPWKLSGAAKLIDAVKFLALGPALLALFVVSRRPASGLLMVLILAGLIAAVLPTPTWRQYLLPVLPPLFVLLAWRWSRYPPGRATRIAAIAFAFAGLAPTAAALIQGEEGMRTALSEMAAVRDAMDAAGVRGPVATLSPQFLPSTRRLPDPRFATGPFYFRSLLQPAGGETPLHLVSAATLAQAPLPDAILTGGEGKWTSGDDRLDARLGAEAIRRGYRATRIDRWRLYVR
jgi:4-amino-4-deoxy-L-arabinose transferase-like glycosyltransferase